jgi:hypothetical protein
MGKNPFWKINYQDEAAVEDYVAKHCIPPSCGSNPEE